MTTTATEIRSHFLTALDIKALKTADDITFRHDGYSESNGLISAVKKIKKIDPWQPDSIRHEFHAASKIDYLKGNHKSTYFKAFSYLNSVQYCDQWKTIANFLKVGDELSMVWRYNNSSPALDAAGMVRDELLIVVTRKNKKSLFLIEVSVGPNNSARMIHQ